MKKNILVIKGSDRKDSFTNRLWQDAVETFSDVEINLFNACSEKFNFCNGCNYCEENGICVHRDLDKFKEHFGITPKEYQLLHAVDSAADNLAEITAG